MERTRENYTMRENGVLSNSGYNHDQLADPTIRNSQDGMNVPSVGCTSSSEATNVAQGYSGYAPYANADPYGYSTTGYATYYNNYQQQTNQYQQPSNQYQQQGNHYQPPSNQVYSHQVGAYQNTGAPYQQISSFQNTGSYAGPTSYSSSYYNTGDYQTSGSCSTGAYSSQTNLWHGEQYATYNSYQYPNYTPDSNSAYSSTTTAATSQYQQHYKQWVDYYNQTQSDVSCAPGTENTSVPGVPGVSCLISSGNSGYATSNNQINAPFTPWKPQPSSSDLSSVQPATANGGISEGYQKDGHSFFQNDLHNPIQPLLQKSQEVIPSYESIQRQQSSIFPQGSSTLDAASYQLSQNNQHFKIFSQTPEPQKSSKTIGLQIPTDPRIGSKLPLDHLKADRDISISTSAVKPAYIGVSIQGPGVNATSHAEVDSVLKPGTFPKSLRGYVERALARCKDDMEKASSQNFMKEIIRNATADGTLYTRDWDTEPLFPKPSINSVEKEDPELQLPTTAVPKNRKSPGRRAKSRWEPIPDVKSVEKSADSSSETVKFSGWNKEFHGGKLENKDTLGLKFSLSSQRSFSKHFIRPSKRQRFGDILRAVDDVDASIDSDKDPSLTKYSSAAISLGDSLEETKRRENRSKRFDKGHGSRAESKKLRAKDVGVGNMHGIRASSSLVSRSYEETRAGAVEDIDWDAFIVKGTCQEIEKRYLRLTSAPDPATVRSEEVLEKALLMVQNSPKNYLYKCDQLKSIRQDLTVQHIRNELTVKVYETHARLAIEVGDLAEYNQCQSQLKALYAEGILGCHMEFAAYNLLCVILHSNNKRDLLSAMSRLSGDLKEDKAVIHALSVRSAVTSGNYVTFFRLYKTAPNLNTFLMDLYVEKMRYAAVKCISRSYRPTVPVSYLSEILGFNCVLPTGEPTDEKAVDSMEECVEWLKAHGACLTSGDSGEVLLDAKASASSIFMPEPEDAVAHGDASLAVNDFLTRSDV